MRILYLGLNYPPECIGIAVYAGGLCEFLAQQGHEVAAVVAKPYYPDWKIFDGFRGYGTKKTLESGVTITRIPLYVPMQPSGIKRVIHHISFALGAVPAMLAAIFSRRPDVIITEAPSLIAAPVAWLTARLFGAKCWLQIQDFEVQAAFATGLLDSTAWSARLARWFEHFIINRFDGISSISHEMCLKVAEMGVPQEKIYELRNWADLEQVQPSHLPSPYRSQWGITTPHVALYSGNIANKQGIEIVVDAARQMANNLDITFVICGNGPNRTALEQRSAGLDNIQFHDLQSKERLGELMALATIHLLPQKSMAADLLLPSKLTNMLASGRPPVVTAHAGTGLAREVDGCGIIVEPENVTAFTAGIEKLMDDPKLCRELGRAARKRAEVAWSKSAIIKAFETRLHVLIGSEKTKIFQPNSEPGKP